MSLKLQKIAFQQPLDDSYAKFVLVAMSFLSTEGEVWAANHTLQSMTGLTERSIRRKIKYLVDHGYLVKHDVDRFQIKDRNADSLSDVSDRNADSLSNVSDSLSIPYIENGKNGTKTTSGGIVPLDRFLNSVDMAAIPPVFAREWYERQEEQGWFFNPRTGLVKPYGKDVNMMVRSCLREFNQAGRPLGQKNSKNNPASRLWQINSHLDELKIKKQHHPGDPAATVPLAQDSSERQDWWKLCEKEKNLKKEKETLA